MSFYASEGSGGSGLMDDGSIKLNGNQMIMNRSSHHQNGSGAAGAWLDTDL